MTGSTDYHDYVIRDGKFIGAFEEMYQNVDDPWSAVRKVDCVDNDVFLAVARHVSPRTGRILDVGCGLGALTARIRDEVPHEVLLACDVSSTAIRKAQESHQGISFFVHDLRQIESMPVPPASIDVVTMSQVIWYILPGLAEVLGGLYMLLRGGGHLVISQYLLAADDQQYGRGIVEEANDLVRFVEAAGFRVHREVYVNRVRPQNVIVWAGKPV